MKIRSFIAIPLDDGIKEKILKNLDINNDYKITKKENLHITMLFLGDIEEKDISLIEKELEAITNKTKKFNLEISRFGQFPPTGIPRIIYVTGENGKEKLYKMGEEIKVSMQKIGFKDNKGFKYHVTVARAKKWANMKIELPEIKDKLEALVDKIELYRSDLTANGPIYTNLWEGYLN